MIKSKSDLLLDRVRVGWAGGGQHDAGHEGGGEAQPGDEGGRGQA